MIGICACCGTTGEVESHHVGARKYSPLVADACLSCHAALSIAQLERKHSNSTPEDRVALGMLDMLMRLSESRSLAERSEDGYRLMRSLERLAGIRYRPSAGIPPRAPGGDGIPTGLRLALARWLETSGMLPGAVDLVVTSGL